ncbi:hypothetical protein Acr_23g0006080 [Actinidia rufa]|uniref:Uncharacterized protein n=1 Tax=Actinidia rufa TaxID=165716 RepID=A0A7J0GN41_9ERIC|nr:hypothetical protein Acr_23g0006080 [Actinidia rufa]
MSKSTETTVTPREDLAKRVDTIQVRFKVGEKTASSWPNPRRPPSPLPQISSNENNWTVEGMSSGTWMERSGRSCLCRRRWEVLLRLESKFDRVRSEGDKP